MPTYCFRCPECGTRRDIVCRVSQRKQKRKCLACAGRGQEVVLERDFLTEAKQVAVPPPGNWPMVSSALGVHASQIREAEKAAQEAGIPTHFTKDGDAILRDRNHRKNYAELRGLYDRNGGYGDPQPKHVPKGDAWFEGD